MKSEVIIFTWHILQMNLGPLVRGGALAGAHDGVLAGTLSVALAYKSYCNWSYFHLPLVLLPLQRHMIL